MNGVSYRKVSNSLKVFWSKKYLFTQKNHKSLEQLLSNQTYPNNFNIPIRLSEAYWRIMSKFGTIPLL